MPPKIVTKEQWLEERRALLAEEKAHMKAGDRLSAKRREVPWVAVDKAYVFDAPGGRRSLADLFGGRGQLIVHHLMFHPDWDAACPGCSYQAEHIDGPARHLVHHDVAVAAVSRAPLAKIEAYRRRMGWRFPWVSSHGSDFNYDFGVSFTDDQLAGTVEYNYARIDGKDAFEELPGLSVFAIGEDGAVYHTYSSYARGNEEVNGVFVYLDITPKGRNETEIMDWVRRHDEYPAAARSAAAE